MKNLIKLAKTNKHMPILQNIAVINGRAWATDIDLWLSVPCDHADGLYQAVPLSVGQFIPAEIPLADFPKLPASEGAELPAIPLTELEWVSRAMSDKEFRYYLQGIYFHADGLVATNGHVLHKSKMALPMTGIIPASMIKAVLANKSEGVWFMSDKWVRFEADGFIAISRLVDGTYPDYMRVIPQGEAAYKFDGSEFARIAKLAKPFVSAAKDKTKHIRLNEGKAVYNCNGIQSEWAMSFDAPECAFNLTYLGDIGISGPAYMADNTAPMRIEQGERTAVIMPMRF